MAASASLAELGAQLSRPTVAPSPRPPEPALARATEVPTSIMNALQQSFDTSAPRQPPPPILQAAPEPPAPAPRPPAPVIDTSILPPVLAASLARLAGQPSAGNTETAAGAELVNAAAGAKPVDPLAKFIRTSKARSG